MSVVPKEQEPQIRIVSYKAAPPSEQWVVVTAIQCRKCRGLIFMEAMNLHGDAGTLYAVCPACITAGWKIHPLYAADHPDIAKIFNELLAQNPATEDEK